MTELPGASSGGAGNLFQKLALLAGEIQKKPWIADVFAEEAPDAYEQALSLAATPFFQWEPFGYTIDDNPCQIGWLKEQAREAWAVCGNRTGKTVSTWIKYFSYMAGIDPLTKEPLPADFPDKRGHIDGWIVSDTEDTSRDIIQRTLVREVLGEDESGFLWNFVDDSCSWTETGGWKDNRFATTNGSRTTFKFATQRRRTFQGTSRNLIWADEEQPKDIMEECEARVVDCNGFLWGTLTPVYEKLRGIPWVYYDKYLPRDSKGIVFHNWSLLHNPFIPDEAKKRLMDSWDEDSREVRVHGSFVPMGIQLAFPTSVIRGLRDQVVPPEEGFLSFDEEGKPGLVQL